MTPLGHVSALPVEELALPLAYGGGALWLAARAWLLARLGGAPDQADDRPEERAR